MRFCLVTSSFPGKIDSSQNAGGFVLDFAHLLQAKGHEVIVITPQISDIPNLEVRTSWSFNSETSISHLSTKSIKNIVILSSIVIGGALFMSKILKNRSIDRILCFWAIPSGLMALPFKLRYRKSMDTWLLGSDVWAAKRYPFGVHALKYVAKQSSHLFADGVRLGQECEELIGFKPTFLASGKKNSPFAEITEGDGERYLAFIGRLHENKGIDLLVDAYIQLISDGINLPKLRIYGNGPLEEFIQLKISESHQENMISLMGKIDDQSLPIAIRSADGFIIPSRMESIPLILGQAATFAKKVLVTNVGDMGELVTSHKAGLVCSPTKSGLMLGIQELLKSNNDEWTDGLSSLSNLLKLESSVDKYLNIILNEAE